MLKRHEIQVLRAAGHPRKEVARLAGTSVRTVRRVEGEPPVGTVAEASEPKSRRVGRPSKAEPFRKFVEQLLRDDPGLMSLEILRRARLQGYDGGKSALYGLVAAVRPKEQRPVSRFEGLPGEFSQHDFGHVDVRFVDGSKKRVHFFASRLKYSRWVEVSLVPDERVETLVRNLVRHFESFGGLPLLAVFDRPKTIALSWRKDGTVTEWNATFASVCLDLGVGVELCWPGRGNQKGTVENLVGWVKGSFFKQRRFIDEEDLGQQLAEWHVEVNTQRPSRATGVVPAVRLAEERPRLRLSRIASSELALRYPITVGPTGEVLFDTHRYSMPPESIGIPGTLWLYQEQVKIVAGRFSATHDRLSGRNGKSTLPEHRAAMLAAVSGRRAKRYTQRQHLLEIGPPALDYLTEVVHRRPTQWAREVDVLHGLLQRHGPDRLRQAFHEALQANLFGSEYVKHVLHVSLHTRSSVRLQSGIEQAVAQQELPL